MLLPHWHIAFLEYHPISPISTLFRFICICKGYLDHVFVQDATHLFELCYACDSKPSRIQIRHQILVRPVASIYEG